MLCEKYENLILIIKRAVAAYVKEIKKSTQFVHLVLTGVCVANFFNIADFDLVFLHNTHILSVCLFVCLMYSTVGMYRV